MIYSKKLQVHEFIICQTYRYDNIDKLLEISYLSSIILLISV